MVVVVGLAGVEGGLVVAADDGRLNVAGNRKPEALEPAGQN